MLGAQKERFHSKTGEPRPLVGPRAEHVNEARSQAENRPCERTGFRIIALIAALVILMLR